jgi:hypothetical protein
VKRLSLTCCRNVVDVTELGNIQDLFLYDCQGIRDISALQNNKKLSVHSCDNISLSTVNFVNIMNLHTDLDLTYSATATLKAARSLKLRLYHAQFNSIFLSSTVTSVELNNKASDELNISLSNFLPTLKYVMLERVTASVDLTPLGNIETIRIYHSHSLENVKGLGTNNRTVTIEFCSNITDFSALKTVPRVIIDRCAAFVNCEDLNQVHYLTIVRASSEMNFSGLKREKGCRVHRLELLKCGLSKD